VGVVGVRERCSKGGLRERGIGSAGGWELGEGMREEEGIGGWGIVERGGCDR